MTHADAVLGERTSKRIAIAALWDGINTARYFESAVLLAGGDASRLSSPIERSAAWPDLQIVVDPCLKSPDLLMAALCPTVGILIDVHQQLDVRLAYARYLDHVFVAQLSLLDAFRSIGHPSAHWLPLACEPAVHYSPGQTRDLEVGFVGKFGIPGSDREQTLRAVLSMFQTNQVGRQHSPEEMGKVYSRARIVFNKSINGDLNMRFFEALASGALLVTDRIGNGLDRVAKEGEHYVAYDTPEEAVALIHHYLADEPARARIAARGQAHAFEHHTYANRLAKILNVVSENPNAKAPARCGNACQEARWRSELHRIQGAPFSTLANLLIKAPWSSALLSNTAIAAARGIVRPTRQALARWRSSLA